MSDNTTLLSAPTLTFGKESTRHDFALTYQPQFEFFEHHGHLSSWNHEAGLRWEYKFAPRWTLTLPDEFH